MTAVDARKAKRADLRKRAAEETENFAFIAAYLLVIFGGFIAYRRLVLHEVGIAYVHYGAAVVGSLVIAKVVLIVDALRKGGRRSQGPLIWPVLYQTALYTAMVIVFVVLERAIEGLVRGESVGTAFMKMTVGRRDEIEANLLMAVVALLGFFALLEAHRASGEGSLFDLFFRGQRR